MKPIQHGTNTAYNNRKCRCEKCLVARRAYMAEYRKLRRRIEERKRLASANSGS